MSDKSSIGNQIIVLFTLDGLRYALDLSVVERIIPMIEVTPLPKAPEAVMGVVNFYGEIIPVINIRRCFNLPVHEYELNDQIVIVHMPDRYVALVVDSVTGVYELKNSQLVNTREAFPYTDYMMCIAEIDEGIVLILDIQKVMDEVLTTIEK